MVIFEMIQKRIQPVTRRDNWSLRNLVHALSMRVNQMRMHQINIKEAEQLRLKDAAAQPQVSAHWRL
jgi:hypothetical protein